MARVHYGRKQAAQPKRVIRLVKPVQPKMSREEIIALLESGIAHSQRAFSVDNDKGS